MPSAAVSGGSVRRHARCRTDMASRFCEKPCFKVERTDIFMVAIHTLGTISKNLRTHRLLHAVNLRLSRGQEPSAIESSLGNPPRCPRKVHASPNPLLIANECAMSSYAFQHVGRSREGEKRAVWSKNGSGGVFASWFTRKFPFFDFLTSFFRSLQNFTHPTKKKCSLRSLPSC